MQGGVLPGCVITVVKLGLEIAADTAGSVGKTDTYPHGVRKTNRS